MKKILLTLSLILLCSASLSAQWYLFPGGGKKAQTETPAPEQPSQVMQPDTAAPDTVASPVAESDSAIAKDPFILDIPEQIKIALVLPLGADGAKPREAMFDFYSGALTAVKEEAQKGLKIAVNVIDSKNPAAAFEIPSVLKESDIILYCAEDPAKAAQQLEGGKCIVSPLGSAQGTDSTVVRLTTTWRSQIDELTRWLKEDTLPGDEIVLLNEHPFRDDCDTLAYLKRSLLDNSLEFIIGQEVNDSTVAEIPGTRRFVNVSGSDKYLFRQLQAASVQGERGLQTTFYSTSRVRNLKGIEDSRMLYNAGARLVAQFAIDYSTQQCRDFVHSYRAIAQAEPTRFAFHGYDTAKYFLEICARYGRNYKLKLAEFPYKGIQSKFEFKEETDAAMTNTAAGRISYNRDLSCDYR